MTVEVVGPELSMPSTVPDWSSTSRWAASVLQRMMSVRRLGLVAPVVGLAVRTISRPASTPRACTGPVPFGSDRSPGAAAAGLVEVVGVIDRQRGEGDLREEGRRPARRAEHDRLGVESPIFLICPCRRMVGVRCLGLPAGALADLGIGHRRRTVRTRPTGAAGSARGRGRGRAGSLRPHRPRRRWPRRQQSAAGDHRS